MACVELLGGADPPTAIFSAHNRLTIGAIRGMRSLERHTTTGLVGFDDFKLADLLQPAVTVIARTRSAWAGSPPSCSSAASPAAPAHSPSTSWRPA